MNDNLVKRGKIALATTMSVIILGMIFQCVSGGCTKTMPDTNALRMKAEKGDAESQYALAIRLREGKGIVSEVNSWLKTAADKGHVKAAKEYGWCLEQSAFDCGQHNKDAKNIWQQAGNYYEKAIAGGDQEAKVLLGWHHLQDTTRGESNVKKARELLAESANAGDLQALLGLDVAMLAENCHEGFSVMGLLADAVWFGIDTYHNWQDNKEKAKKRQALLSDAESGKVEAQVTMANSYETGIGSESDWEKALEWYERAASKGNAQAKAGAKRMRDALAKENDTNLMEKFKELKKKAEDDDAESCVEVAKCYQNGLGVKRNFEAAFQWLVNASMNGNPEGTYRLALCYGQGLGVEKSSSTCKELMRHAASLGHANAQFQYGQLLIDWNDPCSADSRRGFNWLRCAARNGDAEAANLISLFYRDGIVLPRNGKLAADWQKLNHGGAAI